MNRSTAAPQHRRQARPRRADMTRLVSGQSRRVRAVLGDLVDQAQGDVAAVFVDASIQVISTDPATGKPALHSRRVHDHLSN